MLKISRVASSFGIDRSISAMILLALVFSLFHTEQSFGQEFKIYTEEFPPYNYTHKGKVSGISTEIVREILRRLDHSDDIQVALWSNGYRLTQKEDNIILYSTTRTPFREDLLSQSLVKTMDFSPRLLVNSHS